MQACVRQCVGCIAAARRHQYKNSLPSTNPTFSGSICLSIYLFTYLLLCIFVWFVWVRSILCICMCIFVCVRLNTIVYVFFCKDVMVQLNSDLLFSLSFFASFFYTRLALTHTPSLSSSRTRSPSLFLSLSFSGFCPCLCASIYTCATHTLSPLLFVGLYACVHVGSNLNPT